MLRPIFIFITALLLASCAKDSIVIKTVEKKPLQELNIETIAKIAIPVREKGYKNLNTTLIDSQDEFNRFIALIKFYQNWDNRDNLLNALKLKEIDFEKYNFLLYRISELSNSDVLLVDKPMGDKSNIIIKVGKNNQEMKSDKMAYYALGYKVSKDVTQITFDNGIEKEVVKNSVSKSNSNIPNSCLEWFDGCNDCHRGEDETPICTEKLCNNYKEFKCTKSK